MTVAPPNSPMTDADLPGPPTLQRETTGMAQTRLCVTCPTEMAPGKAEYIKQCDECYRDTSTKRICDQCNQPKLLVTDPSWRTTCGTCYKNDQKRKCLSCNEPKIPSYDPVWRTLCSDCFKNKDLYRTCPRCKSQAIRPGTAKYHTMCGPCWIETRQETHEQCPNCKHKDPRFKKKKGMAMCRDCMKEKGLIRYAT
jgi:hypothetical protein